MLTITVPSRELFDERTNEFFTTKEQTLVLEHSLVSLAKWESKWEKPFLGKDDKTIAETQDYVRCMTLTQNVDSNVYKHLSQENLDEVSKYIQKSMTATWFREDEKKGSREIITAEIIYYWMIAQNIPMECQKWHLNRLLTLIRVCSEKNSPGKKMSKNDIYKQNAALNAARRKSMHSKG